MSKHDHFAVENAEVSIEHILQGIRGSRSLTDYVAGLSTEERNSWHRLVGLICELRGLQQIQEAEDAIGVYAQGTVTR